MLQKRNLKLEVMEEFTAIHIQEVPNVSNLLVGLTMYKVGTAGLF